jgi:hypothetical protein
LVLHKIISTVIILAVFGKVDAQSAHQYQQFMMSDSVRVTIDRPTTLKKGKKTVVCFFALPNGNTTEQTMGKKMLAGDDWHFDIQHIAAQTSFIRSEFRDRNFIVVYLENNLKSWPAWKGRHSGYKESIPHIIDSLSRVVSPRPVSIYLNGHSGGGSFLFGYLSGVTEIPANIERISFLDSDYGYDSTYLPKLSKWLTDNKKATLTVFAYNDSVALYNGKPIVSATGGTWYRSHLMMHDLGHEHAIQLVSEDTSLIRYSNKKGNIQFFFKKNPGRLIFHTTQVELNGFIHSILANTEFSEKNYLYYDKRAYTALIE